MVSGLDGDGIVINGNGELMSGYYAPDSIVTTSVRRGVEFVGSLYYNKTFQPFTMIVNIGSLPIPVNVDTTERSVIAISGRIRVIVDAGRLGRGYEVYRVTVQTLGYVGPCHMKIEFPPIDDTTINNDIYAALPAMGRRNYNGVKGVRVWRGAVNRNESRMEFDLSTAGARISIANVATS